MTYVEGFVAAVPAKNKEEYRKHAADAAPLFREFGARRMVECWGDDVRGAGGPGTPPHRELVPLCSILERGAQICGNSGKIESEGKVGLEAVGLVSGAVMQT